ncbi:MAG: thioesterase [Rhodospirillaceae bacterium]|nr:thioesterase [Rhodospirillaceae bacterium]|tara:strand:+ start:46 stop:471 length:426 start_codon:yes stop_codon:yes gene_type:complete
MSKLDRREDYKYILEIPTRWIDNDVYGHVNNVVYYSFFDTAVNHALIEFGLLNYNKSEIIGLVVETSCTYHQPVSFPDIIDAAIKIDRLGNSSVKYYVGLFKKGEDAPCATGYFVHVYVDRKNRRPHQLPPSFKEKLQQLI